MTAKEKIMALNQQINFKSEEQDSIKRELGNRFNYPKDENERARWFTLYSQILDLIEIRDALEKE